MYSVGSSSISAQASRSYRCESRQIRFGGEGFPSMPRYLAPPSPKDKDLQQNRQAGECTCNPSAILPPGRGQEARINRERGRGGEVDANGGEGEGSLSVKILPFCQKYLGSTKLRWGIINRPLIFLHSFSSRVRTASLPTVCMEKQLHIPDETHLSTPINAPKLLREIRIPLVPYAVPKRLTQRQDQYPPPPLPHLP